MIRRWAAPGGALALLLAGPACYATGPPPEWRPPERSTATAGGARAGEVQELARLVNEHRMRRGKRQLVWDEKLARVAQRHSEDMARRHFFSHTNPDGLDPFERLRTAGLRYRAAAENIGEGYREAGDMLDGWLGSPGHRRNLENGEYTHHGIGLHDRHWTHLFVRYPPK